MKIILSVILLLTATAGIYMQHPKFGKTPSGERLARMQRSPHFKNGEFHNLSFTPTFAEGHNLWGELRKQAFGKYPRRKPASPIPTVKTELKHIAKDSNMLVWFGHSSWFMRIDGKNILADPVFSGTISPVPGGGKAFEGADAYTAADLPDIDYLLISHDHYDHLDYKTIMALKGKTAKVICGLGVGAHFEHWGYPADKIIEKDWYETTDIGNGFIIHTLPTRHKSGRLFRQNRTLWVSYLIQTPAMKIYYSGDSGYDTHFAAIGNKYGPIDLAILESGQYDSAWHYIHMLPGEVLQAAQDLRAKRLFPVHNSKFILARHSWDEPLEKLTALNKDFHIPLVTPMIGAPVYLDDSTQTFTAWWKNVR